MPLKSLEDILVGAAPDQFVGDLVADFDQRFDDLRTHPRPLRLFPRALVFLTHHAGAIAGGGQLMLQRGVFDDFLNFPQAIRPRHEILAGDNSAVSAAIPSRVQELLQFSRHTS